MSGRKNLPNICEMKVTIMRPVSQPDPYSDTAIRTSVTSEMAIWLMIWPQTSSHDEEAHKNKSVLFVFLFKRAADDIQTDT